MCVCVCVGGGGGGGGGQLHINCVGKRGCVVWSLTSRGAFEPT